MGLSWCKMASNLDSHPKIRRAGRSGREVFLFVLRQNAEPGNPVPGRLPIDRLEPWYLADQLMMPESDAVTGVTRAVEAGLLLLDGHSYLIVGWEAEWSKELEDRRDATRERVAKYREARDERLKKAVTERYAALPNVTDVTGTESTPRREEKRREETRGEEKRTKSRGSAAPRALDPESVRLSHRLGVRISAANPRSKIARLSAGERSRAEAVWAKDIDALLRIDKIPSAEIESMIEWCTVDGFWSANILSGKSLRSKYDTMLAQRERPAKAQAAKPRTAFEQLLDIANGATT